MTDITHTPEINDLDDWGQVCSSEESEFGLPDCDTSCVGTSDPHICLHTEDHYSDLFDADPDSDTVKHIQVRADGTPIASYPAFPDIRDLDQSSPTLPTPPGNYFQHVRATGFGIGHNHAHKHGYIKERPLDGHDLHAHEGCRMVLSDIHDRYSADPVMCIHWSDNALDVHDIDPADTDENPETATVSVKAQGSTIESFTAHPYDDAPDYPGVRYQHIFAIGFAEGFHLTLVNDLS